MTPDMIAAIIAAGGVALLASGWRMEAATIPPTEPAEGADGVEALPAEDL